MIKIFLIFIIPLTILAQSFIISNIPLPRTYIQNLDPYECDEFCLQDYLSKDMVFSFLAHNNIKTENDKLNEKKAILMSILNMGASNLNTTLKIAMLLPSKKIGKYASTTTNATFAYLMSKNNPFILKSYNIDSENIEDIQEALENLSSLGFQYIIAPFTKKGVENLVLLEYKLNIYVPTVNKNDLNTTSNYITFGGIDYKAQSDLLLEKASSPLVIFSDKSEIGKELAIYQEKQFLDTKDDEVYLYEDYNETLDEQKEVIKYFISRRTTNLEKYLKDNEKIIDASFFMNTPIIKSGMIMSQLTLYDTNLTNILSTQINYDPLLLSMTQYIDRKDMIIANSITKNNNLLIEINYLLDNDIVYDWINYTTTVGIDYFYNLITGDGREYNIDIEDNQMIYDIKLIKPSLSKFIPYK